MKYRILATCLALLVLHVRVQAQCADEDDGFAVPCCEEAEFDFDLEDRTISGRIGSLLDCSVDCEDSVQLVLTNFAQEDDGCDWFRVDLDVVSGTDVLYTGELLLKYSRTWDEPVDEETERQVYRFLANGDLTTPTVENYSCPFPPCEDPFDGVHFIGSLDVACTRQMGSGGPYLPSTRQVRLDLSHLPGCIHHHKFTHRHIPQGLAVGHEDRSWHIVGPAPFDFTAVPALPSAATVAEDAVRHSLLTVVGPETLENTCQGEAQVTEADLTLVDTFCGCDSVVPLRYREHAFSLSWACDATTATFSSLSPGIPGEPVLPQFLSLPIGRHLGSAATWPNQRGVILNLGVLQGEIPCAPTEQPTIVVHGVSTTGVTYVSKGSVLEADIPMDLMNHRVPSNWGTGFGIPARSTLVFNLDF